MDVLQIFEILWISCRFLLVLHAYFLTEKVDPQTYHNHHISQPILSSCVRLTKTIQESPRIILIVSIFPLHIIIIAKVSFSLLTFCLHFVTPLSTKPLPDRPSLPWLTADTSSSWRLKAKAASIKTHWSQHWPSKALVLEYLQQFVFGICGNTAAIPGHWLRAMSWPGGIRSPDK